MSKEKIGIYATKLAVGLIVLLAVITLVQGSAPRKELSEGPIGIENLGTGYLTAKAAVEAKCGKDIQFLEYRVGGYLPESNHEQYSENGFVEYTFTQGSCVPKEVGPYIPTYAVVEATIDTRKNALVDELYVHPLGGDRRSHISQEEIGKIGLSASEVVKLIDLPVLSLHKINGKVVWRARSSTGAEVHEITVNALTGRIQEDRKFTQRID